MAIVLVELHCTGACHTNVHAAFADWRLKAKTIGRREDVGEIVAIDDLTVNGPVNVGDRVGIKWLKGLDTSLELVVASVT